MKVEVQAKKKRKPRTDRNHVIYRITNVVTGEFYIGLTVVRGGAIKKSLGIRWRGHMYKAFVEKKKTVFCEAIKTYGPEAFRIEAEWIVRGKADAHAVEREEIAKHKPRYNQLNTKD